MLEEILQEIDELNNKVKSFAPAVKEDVLQKKVDDIENMSMTDKDFWSKKESKHLLKEQSAIKKFLESYRSLLQIKEDCDVLVELYKEGETSVDWDALMNIHAHKTGCLLSAALMIPAVLAGCDDSVVEQWHTIGDMIGLAFQIQDDILDVTLTAEEFGKSNSDARNEKVTSVTLLGLAEAEKKMHELYAESAKRIEAFKGFKAEELRELIEETAVRNK